MVHALFSLTTGPLGNDRVRVLSLFIVALLGLTSCGISSDQGITDPHEPRNRVVHGFNVALDKNIVRPLAIGENHIIPPQVQQGVVNFSDNLEVPGSVVNDILQLRLGKAVENTTRFLINTTIGIGGVFDPAKAAGVLGKPTDFGETLHVWGVPEGNYIELPVFGPSNGRDAVGKVVDMVLDPMRIILPTKTQVPLWAKIGAKLSDRARYLETFDSVLYDSADSYAQERLLYLEHRRYNLGEAPSADSFEDPYAK